MNKDTGEIKEKLENMKPIKLSDNEKGVLWAKIEGGIRARETYGAKKNTVLGMSTRFVVASLLVALVLTSGSAFTVSAANAAVPGDRLFAIDEAIERIELFFTRQENRAERRLEFARERLEEARAIVALAEEGDNGTSTSTDDAATSTDETPTSTDPSGGDGDEGNRSKRIVRAEHVLNVALGRLENMRERFLAEGDEDAVARIDGIIAELTSLAEEHIAYLESLESDIEETRDEIKELRKEIKDSRNELKFKFDSRRVDDDEDEDDEDEVRDDNRGRRRGFGRFGFGVSDNGYSGGKILLCHIPPGNPENAHTISVGSPSAERAHLAHGDTEGRCGDTSGDGEGDEDDEDGEAKLTVIKVIVNDDDGNSEVEDFELFVDSEEVDSGEENEFEPGDYTVSEDGPEGYVATFSGDCDENGDVTLEDGDDKTCTITNDDEDTEEDTTPPVISGLSAVAGTSTAEVSWDTDEDADSKIWHSTSTPVDTSVAPNEESGTLETSHTLDLTGLNASSTHYYVISSTDGSGNTATSTELTFTTL